MLKAIVCSETSLEVELSEIFKFSFRYLIHPGLKLLVVQFKKLYLLLQSFDLLILLLKLLLNTLLDKILSDIHLYCDSISNPSASWRNCIIHTTLTQIRILIDVYLIHFTGIPHDIHNMVIFEIHTVGYASEIIRI